jgi:DNA-binding winged helix-turn-helix (wHTH) protein
VRVAGLFRYGMHAIVCVHGFKIKFFQELVSGQEAQERTGIMRDCELFGYLVTINETKKLTVNILAREVICTERVSGQDIHLSFRPGRTTLRLLVYLLSNSSGRIIHNKELLLHVWDKHGLRSSNQRLSHAMMKLINSLYRLGCPPDFILHFPREGYSMGAYPARALYICPVNATEQNERPVPAFS